MNNEDSLKNIETKLDKVIGLLSVQEVGDKDQKIKILKRQGFSSDEIGSLLGIGNVRDTKGWKGAKK